MCVRQSSGLSQAGACAETPAKAGGAEQRGSAPVEELGVIGSNDVRHAEGVP